MPTVDELTALHESSLLSPRAGPGVCVTCFNFTDGYERCYACTHHPTALAAVAPISYSVGREQLHHALGCYKRLSGDIARRLTAGIAAVLWRFLVLHEPCVARAAEVDAFPIVTTVPSSDPVRASSHPLIRIAAELSAPTRPRYRPLLARSELELAPHEFHADKYLAREELNGEPVLLIDDTWTTGANAQSAAAALTAAGSGPVGAVVIGRHVNREWHQTDARLRTLRRAFDWSTCALCAD